MALQNKKFIFIAGVVAVIFVAFAIFLFVRDKNGGGKKPSQQQEMIVPDLPESKKRIIINDTNNKNGIKASFEKYASGDKKATETVSRETFFQNKEGQSIDLNDFSEAMNISISPGVKNFIDSKNYSAFYCRKSDGAKEYGIIFNTKKFLGNEAVDHIDLDKKIRESISNWEKTMLKDLQPVIFPDLNFSSDQLNQKLFFKDGKYRFSEITLPDGKIGSINYIVLGTPIIIASSPECMDEALNEFFDE